MKNFKKYFLIIFFIGFLYLPIIGMVFGFQNVLYETRLGDTKSFPKFKNDIGKFSSEFLEYFEDNFGFRYYFMKFAANLKIKLFKTYPRNADLKVLKGKDGWLFYKVGNELEDFQGRVPLSKMALNKIISDYKKNFEYLNDNGIKLYVLIPPDKSVVYSEYMPNKAIYGIKSDKTRINQLLALNSDFIYPKKELLENKGKELLYFKGDTHWTYFGTYFGYKALMDKIGQDFNVSAVSLAELDKAVHKRTPDLERMASISTNKIETAPMYICPDSVKPSDLKIMVFGDSFMEFLEPFIKCTFKNANFKHLKEFDRKKIREEKPDIVIFEIVQRNLRHMFGN